MKVLVLSGSTRAASFNTRLARLVQEVRSGDDVLVRADLATLPFFDADVEAVRYPTTVAELREQVDEADLLVIVTPEYNGTIPGVLGNAVDWLSRPASRSPLAGKDVLVISASPSPGGGRRAAAHLRQVLGNIGVAVRSEGMAVPRAFEHLSGGFPALIAAELDALLEPAGAAA
jgi:chromate reductase